MGEKSRRDVQSYAQRLLNAVRSLPDLSCLHRGWCSQALDASDDRRVQLSPDALADAHLRASCLVAGFGCWRLWRTCCAADRFSKGFDCNAAPFMIKSDAAAPRRPAAPQCEVSPSVPSPCVVPASVRVSACPVPDYVPCPDDPWFPEAAVTSVVSYDWDDWDDVAVLASFLPSRKWLAAGSDSEY